MIYVSSTISQTLPLYYNNYSDKYIYGAILATLEGLDPVHTLTLLYIVIVSIYCVACIVSVVTGSLLNVALRSLEKCHITLMYVLTAADDKVTLVLDIMRCCL